MTPDTSKTSGTSEELQPRDGEILETLAARVRVMSLSQIAQTWWPKAKRSLELADDRLQKLATGGWLHLEPRWARPELPISAPLAAWQPGLTPPDFPALAAHARLRWKEPAVLTRCASATDATAVRFGGTSGRFSREAEVTHDLHLARVYLLMRSQLPTRARSWRSEDLVQSERIERAEKLPDALVTDGRHTTAIEFVGVYSAEKLRQFHAYCVEQSLAYELW